ncbi:MAG: hypothetical protein ACRDWE_00245, partial [Acidimicrobiales bacterium]
MSAVARLDLARPSALTDALLDESPAPFGPEEAEKLAASLRRGIASAAAGAAAPFGPGERSETRACGSRLVRVGAYQVALAGAGSAPAVPAVPFRWTARRARRAIGLAALRAVLDGRCASVSEAVAGVAA